MDISYSDWLDTILCQATILGEYQDDNLLRVKEFGY